MSNSIFPQEPNLLEFGIDLKSTRLSKPRWKGSHYRAIVNWLIYYKPTNSTSDLEKVKGYIEALYHLATVQSYKPIDLILNKVIEVSVENEITLPLFDYLMYIGSSQLLLDIIQEIIDKFSYSELTQIDFLAFLRARAISGVGNLTEACKLCNDLYEKLSPEDEIYVEVLTSLGGYQIQSGKYSEGEENLLMALSIVKNLTEEKQQTDKKLKLLRIETDIYESLAFYYMNRSRFKDGLAMYSKVSEMRKESGDYYKLISPLVHRGIILRRMKFYDEAISCLMEAQSRAQDFQDQNGIIWSAHHLGWVFLNCQKLALAEFQCKKALEGYKLRGDQRGISDSYEQMALIYLAKDEIFEAEKNIQLAINIRRNIGNQHGIASCTMSLALIAWHKRHYWEFFKYLALGFQGYYKIGVLNRIRLFRILNLSYVWTLGKRNWTM